MMYGSYRGWVVKLHLLLLPPSGILFVSGALCSLHFVYMPQHTFVYKHV